VDILTTHMQKKKIIMLSFHSSSHEKKRFWLIVSRVGDNGVS